MNKATFYKVLTQGIAYATLPLFIACAPSKSDSDPQTIVGANSILYAHGNSAEFERIVRGERGHPRISEDILPAIGLLDAKDKKCTVTFVTARAGRPGVALTAGHCLPPRGSSCEGIKITWLTSRGDLASSQVAECDRVLINTHTSQRGRADIGVFSLKSGSFRPTPIEIRRGNLGSRVWLVGFPEGRLAWSSDEQCEVDRNTHIANETVLHRCDTLRGNSGALIFDNQKRIVGIHTGDHEERRSNIASIFDVIQSAVNDVSN